jgi:hypothetical protein
MLRGAPARTLPRTLVAQVGGSIPPHAGYEKLLFHQKAGIVFDGTAHVCDDFIDRRGRAPDHMVQAARSGKPNIVEGSMASGTSKETEIKLTNVSRANLGELLADYRDFLRVRTPPIGGKGHPQAQVVRTPRYGTNGSHANHAT